MSDVPQVNTPSCWTGDGLTNSRSQKEPAVVPDESLAQRVERVFRQYGIVSAGLVSVDPAGPDGVSEAATFELDDLLLRFVRERTEVYLDIATKAPDPEFHQFDDVEIALGWTSVEEVLKKASPEPLDSVIARVARCVASLKAELYGPHAEWTRARILRANSDRAKLRRQRLG
jgi:hypothetical protein